MIDLTFRADATKKTLERYRDRAFDWKSRATCIHLAATQLRNLGHRPPPIPQFRSPLGAKRALKKEGFETISELLDAMLPPIAPAAAVVGDLATLEGDEGFDAIVLYVGGKWLGWHPDDPSGVRPLIVSKTKGAWRT